MRIAVIMPSYLGEYPGAAKDREKKLVRAVKSFSDQNHKEKALVIVSDGCEITNRMFENELLEFDNLNLVEIEKQPLFSGNVRMQGISYARHILKADLICYLDTDDIFLPGHLQNIANAFTDDLDWIYFNDTLMVKKELRISAIQFAHIGTSNIAHRANVPILWGDGYGHDFSAIKSLLRYKGTKHGFATYGVCHCPNEPNKFDV